MKIALKHLLSLLRIRSAAAGLEVSDQVLRLVRFDGRTWQWYAVRLDPGILENGRIKDRSGFLAALAALKAEVYGPKKKKPISVIVCLGSIPSYTQVLTLPIVKGEDFEQAVSLNLKIASPLEIEKAYAGWQLVGRDLATLQDQVLAVFIERQVVDDMTEALFEAGFLTMMVESRALSLVRMLREQGAGIDVTKSYVFVNIDNTGLDFLIVRNGALFFEYSVSWRDLMNEKGEIGLTKFKETLAASIRQVVNFYNQHWTDAVSSIILSAVALGEEAAAAIARATAIPVTNLTLTTGGQAISPEWLVAFGCGLRGEEPRSNEREISLMGEDSRDRFFEERLLNFMQFWRTAVPAVLSVLIATFILADWFLIDTKDSIEARSDFHLGADQIASITNLQSAASDFNRSVALISSAEGSMQPKGALIDKILSLAASNQITASHISFPSQSAPIVFFGNAASQNAIVAFKTAIEANPNFNGVDLPLTGIKTNGSGYSFSMTFVYAPK